MVGEMEGREKRHSPDYLMQLMNDKKLMSSLPNFCGIFQHLERLLDEEISRVRKDMYIDTLNSSERISELPDAVGPNVQLQEKLFVPTKEHPDPAAPAHCSVEDDAGYHRVIKHLQHGPALKGVERSEPPEEQQATLTLLVDGISVYCPVQFVVQGGHPEADGGGKGWDLQKTGAGGSPQKADGGDRSPLKTDGGGRTPPVVDSEGGTLQAELRIAGWDSGWSDWGSQGSPANPSRAGSSAFSLPRRSKPGYMATRPVTIRKVPSPYSRVPTTSAGSMWSLRSVKKFNFVGRILGPRGLTAKQLEAETGCKIMVRGRGSMRDRKKEEQNRGKPNWEHLNEDLHVLITVDDTQNRAEIKLRRAVEEVNKLLVPAFVLEADASETRIGAVLSQRFRKDNKLHPCSYLSHRLSPSERNYSIGDRELRAVKLALEEWQHWLEGASPPFIIWTDHRNLEYLKSAKRLNARQAHWSLIFSRFNFSLSYCPDFKSAKPDALSRMFFPEEEPAVPETILPTKCFVGAALMDIEPQVLKAQSQEPGPGNGPPNCLFVPLSTNGQTERANQGLEVALRCMISSNASSWSRMLPWVEYAHSSLPTASTGLSLFQCCLGYQPPLFAAQEEEVAVPSAQAFVQQCRWIWKRARICLLQSVAYFKKQADNCWLAAPLYRVGQRVWLSTKNLPLKVLSSKLGPRVINGGETFKVSKLLRVRRRGRGLQYLADWVGFGPEERSWIPTRFIVDRNLIRNFHRDNPGALDRTPGGAEGEDSLKKMQLMELAILNGTYRDANIKPSSLAFSLAASSQTPRFLSGPAPVLAPPTTLRTPAPAGPAIMPLIRQIQTVLPNGTPHTAALMPGTGPESGLIYAAPYDYPYALAAPASILEYPLDSGGVLGKPAPPCSCDCSPTPHHHPHSQK
ncbi:hypothetical protein L3Q82_012177 [Scortum barcoo]|uniref:Uncharacterized protein n=1 Tax=Scortum barcoo TaxID=214431 RepID=A0ACB8W6Q2_9TELE|nr:hypothetical protein L3Q82_012177 [Scortum barcoo]